jgi:hypothetical protein
VEHRCHSFQARLWASWTDSAVLPQSPPVGGLMIRAESPATKTRPAQYCRATWASMLSPRTLRSVQGIWGRSLTSTSGRPAAVRTIPTTRSRPSSSLRSTRAWDRSRCRRPSAFAGLYNQIEDRICWPGFRIALSLGLPN